MNRITLGIEFKPLTEDWRVWCNHALKFLKEHKDCNATLTWNAEVEGFALEGIPGVEQAVWFTFAEHYWHQWDALLKGWMQLLGPDAGIYPIARAKRRMTSNGWEDGVELAAQVRGTASHVGVYRLLAQILMKHEFMTEGDRELLVSLKDTLLARREQWLDNKSQPKNTERTSS